jgi:hypothetical protein
LVANCFSEIHKHTIDTVEETEKTNISTLENITISYREATGQAIDKQHMLQKLAELKKMDVVRSVISKMNFQNMESRYSTINFNT